jgi:hypothetical protein
MATANDKIADAVTERAIDLLRFTASQRRDAKKFLKLLEADIVAQLAKIDPTGIGSLSRRAVRLEKLLKQVKATIVSAYRTEGKRLANELRELADLEAGFAANAINSAVGVDLATTGVTRNQLTAIVKGVLVQGSPISEWWSRQAGDTLERFTDNMRVGIAQGETNAELIRRVRGGTQNGAPVNGFMDISRRNADTLVRSATQAVSQKARQATYEQNKKLISSIQWLSTLDNRTTVVCSVRDNLLYTADGHKPIGHSLPWDGGPGNLHWGCRSTSMPVLKPFGELGLDPSKFPAKTRASMTGQVPRDTTVEGWLSRRTVAQQDAQLGKGRAKLWRDGKISFRDLLDVNGRELTLADLRALGGKAAVVKAKPIIPKPKTSGDAFGDVWKDKSAVEQKMVAPAFAQAAIGRLAIIQKVGDLVGGLKNGKGSYHRGSEMGIQMDAGLNGEAYNRVMRHEYGHHIDARIEVDLMQANGATKVQQTFAIGPSRLAIADLKNDAIALEKSVSADTFNGWAAKPPKETAGFAGKVADDAELILGKFRAAVLDGRLNDEINAQFTARNLDYGEAKAMFKHMFTDGTDAERRLDAASFLASFDNLDHVALIYKARANIDHASALSGISDSLGAATNQRIGYKFGHKKNYYAKFRAADRQIRHIVGDKDPFGPDSLSPTSGRYAYGTGNTAQLWANWFEAYTSGNRTQYSVFVKFFPTTSEKFEGIIKEYLKNGTL